MGTELGQRNWNRAIDGQESQTAKKRTCSAAIRVWAKRGRSVGLEQRSRNGDLVRGIWNKTSTAMPRFERVDLEHRSEAQIWPEGRDADFDRYAAVREEDETRTEF